MLSHAALSAETLSRLIEQSIDCVKLIDTSGRLVWMNPNGLCAMEVDDFDTVKGRPWSELWPDDTRERIRAAWVGALDGTPVRLSAFCPTAKGTPRWWDLTVSRVTDVDGRPAGLLAVSRDVTERELARQAADIATAEMRHRLRNTYAMIGGLLLGFARGDAAREAFARDMNDRLASLSRAQVLFSTDDAPCDVAELVPALIAPFGHADCRVELGGLSSASVSQNRADAIALVLGELAVNSAKHGALAHGGRIAVEGGAVDGVVTVRWREASVRAVRAVDRPGSQGLGLIDRIVQARFGRFDLAWTPGGPVATLTFEPE